MSDIKVSKPIKGAPENFENQLQKMIYDQLDLLGIDYRRVENDPAVTMEDCKVIDRVFGVDTIKTVFLTNRQKSRFYLLSMPADKPFITRHFCSALQIARVSFANESLLEELLSTPQGAASPLNIIYDKDLKIEMCIDRELCDRDNIVCPDGTLHGYICLPLIELIDKYLVSTGHKPKILVLQEEDSV